MVNKIKSGFSSKNVKDIEDHILKCRNEAFVILADHSNQDSTIQVAYDCPDCGRHLLIHNNRDRVIDYAISECVACKDTTRVAILNVRNN